MDVDSADSQGLAESIGNGDDRLLAKLCGCVPGYRPVPMGGIGVLLRFDKQPDKPAKRKKLHKALWKRIEIFDPFRRGETSRRGLGLGLYITDQIVRAHGGSVVVESDTSGTTFRVTLPR